MSTTVKIYFTLCVLSLYHSSCSASVFASTVRNKKTLKGDPVGSPVQRHQKHRRNSSISRINFRTEPAADHPDLAYLPDVSVTCAAADFVVRVKPAFFGFGAGDDELMLGRSCRSNGVLGPHGDLLFTYPLTACDSSREVTPEYLVYKFLLHYVPSPTRFPRRSPVQVEIECHYQRNHHVHKLAVQPTWETTVVKKGLKGIPNDFKMELMDESWSHTALSQVYQPGQTIHIQVSSPQMPAGGKLYIKNCYATPDALSSTKYTIIDNLGCLLDSMRDLGASRFVSRTDSMLRFSLKAFQFISDPDTEMSIHCHLFATSEEPGPSHKSCSYVDGRWSALRGHDSICHCCDSHCVAAVTWSDFIEGAASSELLVSDEPDSGAEGPIVIGGSDHNQTNQDEWPGSDQNQTNQDEWPSPRFWMDRVNEEEEEKEQQQEDDDKIHTEPLVLWEQLPDEGSGLDSWSEVDAQADVQKLKSKIDEESDFSEDAAETNTSEEHEDVKAPAEADQELTWYFSWT